MTHPAADVPRRTPLRAAHLALNAKMVPFGGWDMPIQYPTGILAEARAVRSAMGMFDVSHMGRIWFNGEKAVDLLQRVLTADVRTLKPGRAKYCLILNEQGGIIDDVIISNVDGANVAAGVQKFLLVCNAGNRAAVVPWIQRELAKFPGTTMKDDTETTVMIALQGPQAIHFANALMGDNSPGGYEISAPPSELRMFALTDIREDTPQRNLMPGPPGGILSRTGYTGEDGVEIILPATQGVRLWQLMEKKGIIPAGLGARDVLRLEASLPLHGNDIDATTTPLEAGLGRFLQEGNTEFIGKSALDAQKAQGLKRKLIGFKLLERGVPRHGFSLTKDGAVIGSVTSGGVAPTIEADIGMGYVPIQHATIGTDLAVDIRGRMVPAEIVPMPFYSRKREQQTSPK